MNLVIVGVGSNIEPEQNVRKAKELIGSDCKILKTSKFYWTEPLEFKNQDDFLNGGWLLETAEDQNSFKNSLLQIENKLGRIRTENKNGPRTIDLDIIVWNGNIVDSDYYNREFLQQIVSELDSNIK